MTTNEKIEQKVAELMKVWSEGDYADSVSWHQLARHVLASEIESEIKGLCFCHPDLNSKSGITIQEGSNKHFALKRKIELEKILLEIKQCERERLIEELWKTVLGYEGIYSVSSLGRLRRETTNTNVKAGTITKGCQGKHYSKISIRKNGIRKQENIHEVIAEAFLGKRPKGMYVNHIDGNKKNNCANNLEYVTPKENIRQSVVAGTHPRGSRIAQSKLTEQDIITIKWYLSYGKTCTWIAKKYGVTRPTIGYIKNNMTWRHV